MQERAFILANLISSGKYYPQEVILMWTEDINALEIILRTTITFVALLLLTRFFGKEQLSQLTMFNYITGITIGSISADLAGQAETPFVDGMISLIMWTLLTLLVSWISLKSMRAKTLLDDEPFVVIRKGKILQRELKASRLPVEDLKMLLRLQGIFSITEVEHAILETNGELSVYKKAGYPKPDQIFYAELQDNGKLYIDSGNEE